MPDLGFSRIATVLSSSIGVAACSLITALSSARALGADGRGDLATVVAPYLALVVIAGGGLPYAIASLSERRPTTKGSIETTGLYLAGAAGMLASALLVTWAFAVSPRSVSDFLPAAAVLPPALLLAVLLEYERQRGAGRLYNLTRLLPAVATAVFSVVLWNLGVNDPRFFILALLLPNTVAVAVLAVLRRSVFAFAGPAIQPAFVRGIFKRAIAAWPSALTDTVLMRSDQLFLAVSVSPSSLGTYAVAATIAEAGGILRLSLNAAAYESIALSDPQELRRRWRSLLVRLGVLAIPAYCAVGLLMHFSAVPILGSSFAGISGPLATLLAAQLALDIHLTSGTILLARNRAGLFSTSSAIAAGLHVAALFPGVSLFGIQGAALASLIGYACGAVITNIMVSRLIVGETGGRDAGRLRSS